DAIMCTTILDYPECGQILENDGDTGYAYRRIVVDDDMLRPAAAKACHCRKDRQTGSTVIHREIGARAAKAESKKVPSDLASSSISDKLSEKGLENIPVIIRVAE
ncbi:unnamed protein product, partial [Prorocentrum cordatum]